MRRHRCKARGVATETRPHFGMMKRAAVSADDVKSCVGPIPSSNRFDCVTRLESHFGATVAMRHFGLYLVGIALAGFALDRIASASAQSAGDASPAFITKIPAGYRDWKLISVAHEEANLNSF